MSKIEFKPKSTIIFDGDSLTNLRGGPGHSDWPYLRLMNWDRNWADLLAEYMFCWYPELELTMRNVAVGGSSTADILSRFDEFVAPHKPAWVLMTMGANDVNKNLSEEETRTNLKKYIEKLKSVSNGRLAIVGGFQLCPRAPQSKADKYPQQQARTEIIREVLENNDAVFIDIGDGLKEKADTLYQQWEGHTIYCDIDSHFSQLGSMIIAGEVMRELGYLK